MSALRPAFFILYLESFISRLNVILCHDLTLSVGEPDNAAAQTRSMRFEHSGGGQEPSRGHKFSILENFLSIRDFTSQTLASFPSDLVGACLPQTLLAKRDETSILQKILLLIKIF